MIGGVGSGGWLVSRIRDVDASGREKIASNTDIRAGWWLLNTTSLESNEN
jgi:hypothetical protein